MVEREIVLAILLKSGLGVVVVLVLTMGVLCLIEDVPVIERSSFSVLISVGFENLWSS